jgi:hypothetical protein
MQSVEEILKAAADFDPGSDYYNSEKKKSDDEGKTGVHAFSHDRFVKIAEEYRETAKATEALLSEIKEGKLSLDLNNHDFHAWEESYSHETERMVCMAMSSGFGRANKALLAGKRDGIEIGYIEFGCHKCGKDRLKFIIKDNKIVLGDACPYPEKEFPEYSIELDIPSGKMLVTNVLHQWFNPWVGDMKDQKYKQENNICHLHGQKRDTERQASNGCGEFHISNCGCDMYQMDGTAEKFVMGFGYWEDDEAEHNYFDDNGGIQVADVCTGYWGYYMVDLDEFLRRAGPDELEMPKRIDTDRMNECILKSRPNMTAAIVKCVPGRYRFTHRYHLVRESDKGKTYTTIERIGDSQGDTYEWDPAWMEED